MLRSAAPVANGAVLLVALAVPVWLAEAAALVLAGNAVLEPFLKGPVPEGRWVENPEDGCFLVVVWLCSAWLVMTGPGPLKGREVTGFVTVHGQFVIVSVVACRTIVSRVSSKCDIPLFCLNAARGRATNGPWWDTEALPGCIVEMLRERFSNLERTCGYV